jgi:hypothetical protein
MRELTFKGFITRKIKKLSSNNTISIYKLIKEASTTNPELMETLLLYAAISGKTNMLLNAAKKSNINNRYLDIINKYFHEMDEDALKETIPKLPHKFKVIYEDYVKAKNKNKADDPSKAFYKKEILKISKKNKLSISAIAKKTGLKRGNAYRFFSKNQQNYLSVKSLKRALEILKTELPSGMGG